MKSSLCWVMLKMKKQKNLSLPAVINKSKAVQMISKFETAEQVDKAFFRIGKILG